MTFVWKRGSRDKTFDVYQSACYAKFQAGKKFNPYPLTDGI